MADSRPKTPKPANKTPPKSPGDPAKDKAAKRLSLESEGASEGAAAAGPELSALEEAFRRFAVHGDTRATGKEMHGKNWSKLCRDCQVIDGRNVTITDVDIVFSKIKYVCAWDQGGGSGAPRSLGRPGGDASGRRPRPEEDAREFEPEHAPVGPGAQVRDAATACGVSGGRARPVGGCWGQGHESGRWASVAPLPSALGDVRV